MRRRENFQRGGATLPVAIALIQGMALHAIVVLYYIIASRNNIEDLGCDLAEAENDHSQEATMLMTAGVHNGRPSWAKTVLGTAFALVCLAGVATVLIAVRTASVERLVSENYEVRHKLSVFLSNLQDAETGQRGFLLTSNPAYLQPYTRAEESVSSTLRLLYPLAASNADLQPDINELRKLVDAKFGELRKTIALEQQAQHTAALNIVTSNYGKDLMDAIRAHVQTITEREIASLAVAQNEATKLRSRLAVLVCLNLVAAAGLSGFLMYRMLGAIATAQARTMEVEIESKLRGEAEETLRQAQKMEAVGQLTGGIAHDFNNLLAVIKSNAEDIRDDLTDSPLLKEQAGLILEATDRGAVLVAGLMAFARKQELQPVFVDINPLLDRVVGTLRNDLPANIEIETLKGSVIPSAHIDRRRLETAMLSLANNARDAMPNGGVLTIETSLAALDAPDPVARAAGAQEEYVLIAVTDTGAGMTKKVLEQAFVPFFTTKEVGQGAGLGLSTVYGFVKQSGGSARIYSEEGFGTVVKLYLPTGAKAQPGSAELPDLQQNNSRKGRILVVEDDQAVRESTARTLVRLGYTVTTACNAHEAIEILESHPRLDFVLSDVIMPGRINGFDLARKVRCNWPSVKIILTSGYTRATFGKLDVPEGVHFLSKPYSNADLTLALA
jgi:signal transduction histidine kinase